jgi:diguanylate cyclase (GGDEF)-like protein
MRILIADDDSGPRTSLVRMLESWRHETIVAQDGIQAWVELHRRERPSVAILDWRMPGMDGLQVCRSLRQEAGSYVYVLVLTGRSERKDLLAAFEAGADDFVSKPFEPEELRARLQVAQRILDLEAALIASREALRVEATHDSLTGAKNRGAILETLEQELARAKRDGSSVAALLFDLDHFKLVNDRYGHLAGDAALRELVRRIRSTMRSYDSLGRYGGEEFLAVLPSCDAQAAAALARRILARVSESPLVYDGQQIRLTVSAGIASTDGHVERGPHEILRLADLALYTAKNRGRNRAETAPPEPTRTTTRFPIPRDAFGEKPHVIENFA